LSSSSSAPSDRDSVRAQLRGWATLRALHPAPIDLSRVSLAREALPEQLTTPEGTAQLVLDLGLNDEGVREFPDHLHAQFGGLRIWQYPEQFGPYLHHVGRLGVRSYLEVGVRHGGSFVATVEYLQRWSPMNLAVAVDIIPAPALAAYAEENAHVRLAWLDSRSEAFRALLSERGPFDLVFVDSHHEEEQCRAEVTLLAQHARMIALHDITNVGCPGVGRVWRELADSPDYRCTEFTYQYPGMGPFMGIGLAVKRTHRA
jgi:cephalosporin hydroxylase